MIKKWNSVKVQETSKVERSIGTQYTEDKTAHGAHGAIEYWAIQSPQTEGKCDWTNTIGEAEVRILNILNTIQQLLIKCWDIYDICI